MGATPVGVWEPSCNGCKDQNSNAPGSKLGRFGRRGHDYAGCGRRTRIRRQQRSHRPTYPAFPRQCGSQALVLAILPVARSPELGG